MFKRSFFQFFPVPKYLAFPAVGFDISDGSVKYIQLLRFDDSIRIGKFGRKKYSDDLIEVLSGIQRENSFSMINLSIPEEEAFFVRIRLPYIKPLEIRTAIELQLDEYIPYPADQVEFDYEVLRTDPRSGGYIDVSVSVLPKKIVQHYTDILKRSGLQPLAIMIEAEATARATVPEKTKETIMIVNIGRIDTVISVVSMGAVQFSYTFKFGGDLLVRNLEETCRMTTLVAEKTKNEKGLINTPDNSDVFGCLLPVVSSVRDEIKKRRKYWSENRAQFLMAEDSTDITRAIICGSQAIIPGLVDYFSSSVGIDVVRANPWVNLFSFDEYIPPIDSDDALEYATAIGLAMSSLK